METLWFCLVAFMIVGYVVLDGFDLGVGMMHLFVARTDSERCQVLQSIGPVWDGNEVWLIAGGGTLYFAFPGLYASSFSGFYLPLMIVLWLLILRGCSIEFRNHVRHPVWTPFWDLVFAVASTLLAVFFGAALGNVVRGVPLDGNGDFFLPLWTNFQPGPEPGILDWYTIATGILAAVALALHGALWVAYKTTGEVEPRSVVAARRTWWILLVLTGVVTAATWSVQPLVPSSFAARPWGWIFPAVAVAGLTGVWWFLRDASRLRDAFLASCVFIVGMLGSVAFSLFPYVLPSVSGAHPGLTVSNTAAGSYGLAIGLVWWIPGMLLASGYAFLLYRRFGGKVPGDLPATTE